MSIDSPLLKPLDAVYADLASRVYEHQGCGETKVSGEDFVMLECPFRPVSGTFCAACKSFVALDQVTWSDSGEKISDYRSRISASVSFWRKMYLALFANAYEGALNLRLDERNRIVQPLDRTVLWDSGEGDSDDDEAEDERAAEIRRLIEAGRLKKTYMRPLAWGGPDLPLNQSYLPPAAIAEKEQFEVEVEREIDKGIQVEYSANFEYDGEDRLPAKLILKAHGPGVNLKRTIDVTRHLK